MNREIKFRAWSAESSDEKDNPIFEMINANSLAISNYDLLIEQLKDKDNFKLMQFTGLLDKNGKEIYEGDLVKQSSDLCEIQRCIGGFDCQILIELKNGGTINGSTYNFSFLLERACEVVGNIYENPELIAEASQK
jgi:uncharacterized phage protein (TIGR01671 family)